ncbi:hypothetical protein XacyCFBP2565_07030 [Xanthomonas arboricola pv. corylina]|uniref:DNA-methyltransferase n=1 Tax=Xanthomonas arboricola TaxID=56448 RepID=UPI000CEE639D|nr:site-specific DNA-methyltransferase [Xanthomonas arboricola]PPU15570.1 hypothetical protein XacyCFBP2565_07030 [Xanthomonas arboricola pv. corylina]
MIHVGDCLSILPTLANASVDAIVTDPPYGLSFMGKRWDYDVPSTAIWAECLRVLKPGGHLLAFAGTRTQHRMAVRIEDAGFEIRDMIAWVYGSGFPKSHNGEWGGTALKPALEPITMARKPLIGTVEANHLAYGTGALKIDACRVSVAGETNPSIARRQGAINHLSTRTAAEAQAEGKLESRQTEASYRAERIGEALGRWPANLVHDGSPEVLGAFPDAPGQQGDLRGHSRDRKSLGIYGDMAAARDALSRGDSGSAARFFYCAKASKADRDEGLDDQTRGKFSKGGNVEWDNPYLRGSTDRKNNHPTVKPTDLMRYLCRLVTPAGGTVLDPFMGSGSTGKAAALEGFAFVGIEMDPAYAAIAEARIAAAIQAAAREAALPTQIGLPLGDVA